MVTRPPLAPSQPPRQGSEWIGTVLQPAELLAEPDSAAQRQAMLDAGARVMVLQNGPTWLRVRTERGGHQRGLYPVPARVPIRANLR